MESIPRGKSRPGPRFRGNHPPKPYFYFFRRELCAKKGKFFYAEPVEERDRSAARDFTVFYSRLILEGGRFSAFHFNRFMIKNIEGGNRV